MRLVLGFVQACYQRRTTMAAKTEQACVKQKVFVFQCSKPSVRAAGGNNRPDTDPLFLHTPKYKSPNVSVHGFWLSALVTSQKIGDQR